MVALLSPRGATDGTQGRQGGTPERSQLWVQMLSDNMQTPCCGREAAGRKPPPRSRMRRLAKPLLHILRPLRACWVSSRRDLSLSSATSLLLGPPCQKSTQLCVILAADDCVLALLRNAPPRPPPPRFRAKSELRAPLQAGSSADRSLREDEQSTPSDTRREQEAAQAANDWFAAWIAEGELLFWRTLSVEQRGAIDAAASVHRCERPLYSLVCPHDRLAVWAQAASCTDLDLLPSIWASDDGTQVLSFLSGR